MEILPYVEHTIPYLIMGQSCYSHLNLWALSTLLHSKIDDIELVLTTFEDAHNLHPIKNGSIISNEDYVPPDPIADQNKYKIHENEFAALLKITNVNDSDSKVFIDLFRLIDVRGSSIVNLKDVCISIASVTSTSLRDCFSFCFSLFDRDNAGLIDKPEIIHFLKVLNDTCGYCGDKTLQISQLYDLVDSIYTSAGKIDGPIVYRSIIESLSSHPIVEMMLSPQFQGSFRSKVGSIDQINAMIAEES